jgi:hypothetical protein
MYAQVQTQTLKTRVSETIIDQQDVIDAGLGTARKRHRGDRLQQLAAALPPLNP